MATRDDLARRCISELVREVFAHRRDGLLSISYDDLARRIHHLTAEGKPVAIAMGRILATTGHLLEQVADDWGDAVPHLTALVVAKEGRPDAGLPSPGMDEFWPSYSALSRTEKERKVLAERDRIANFGSRWNDVLRALQLPPVSVPTGASSPLGARGESPEHIALKVYVREHPECVGAVSGSACVIEYALPSGDEIDVFFRSTAEWLAVEVKASTSDRLPREYERGLYQTINTQRCSTPWRAPNRRWCRPGSARSWCCRLSFRLTIMHFGIPSTSRYMRVSGMRGESELPSGRIFTRRSAPQMGLPSRCACATHGGRA